MIRGILMAVLLVPAPVLAESSWPETTNRSAAPDPVIANGQNPADLVDAESAVFAARLTVTRPDLNSLGSGPPLSGLPPDEYDYQQADALRRIDFGVNLPLWWGLHLGVSGAMPEEFMKVHALSGEERTYLRYSERNQRPEIYTALAGRLPLNLALGLGVYHTLEAEGDVQLSLSDTDSRGRALIDVGPVQIPYGGLRWQQTFGQHGLTVQVMHRQASATKTGLDSQIVLDTRDFLLPADASAELALFYEPAMTVTSLTWSFHRVALALSYGEEEWSSYEAPVLRVDSVALAPTSPRPLRLRDSREWHGSLAWSVPVPWGLSSVVKAGTGFRTSALPDQPDNLALIDLPARSWLLAARLRIPAAATGGPDSVAVDLALRDTLFEDRTFSDGAETIRAGGRVRSLTGGISFEH